MYLRELILENDKKQYARVFFEKGVNIISGVSDTGKTYIYQCINYLLCSQDEPKKITEAKEYITMYLEIEIQNVLYTIKRIRGKKDVIVYNCKFDDIENCSIKESLFAQHSGKNVNNLSSWLLKKLNNDTVVIHNKKESVRNISFRDLMHFCCADEEKIISEYSPFYTNQLIMQTEYKSIFKYLISGIDDNDVQNKTKSKIKNKKVHIDYINEEIKSLTNNIINLKKDYYKNIEKINLIDDINIDIDKYSKKLGCLNIEIQQLNLKLNNENIKLLELSTQSEQLNNLMKDYNNQLKDIKKFNDFTDIVNQLPSCNCPLCNQKIDINILDKNNITEIHNYYNAKYIELESLKEELQRTLNELNKKILNQNNICKKLKENIEINSQNTKKYSDLLFEKNQQIGNLKELQLNYLKIEMYKERLTHLEMMKEELSKKDSNSKKENKGLNNINFYLNELKNIIQKWSGTDIILEFNEKNNDIIINKKNRNSYGKGYRAFYSTAMLIALQRFLHNKDRKYPGIVIIDSPLVSLKEQKHLKGKELINNYMQNNMIEDLISNANKGQVILFENKEFDEYKNKLHYLYYSSSVSDGFIPKL